ncbi:MAG: hypothetical protein ABI269_00370 [Lapillicoccus sp.]
MSVVPSTTTGVASLASVTVTVHPGVGRTDTSTSGVLSGKVTTTFVVVAVASSLGTLNVSSAYLPVTQCRF